MSIGGYLLWPNVAASTLFALPERRLDIICAERDDLTPDWPI